MQKPGDRGTWLTGGVLVLVVVLAWGVLLRPAAAVDGPAEPPTDGGAWSSQDAIATLRARLRGRGIADDLVAALDAFGLSSIANVLGAIKTAKLLGLGADDVIVTIATDGARMYRTEVDKVLERDFAGTFGPIEAAETFGRAIEGQSTSDMMELSSEDRERIFNLGYFTWVEQQGVSVEDFTIRRDRAFWRALRDQVSSWDAGIRDVNAAVAA
jgi:hypothetical protein